MGLLFVCYQHDLEKGFLTVQKRLNGEALEGMSNRSAGATSLFYPAWMKNTIWESRCCRLIPTLPVRVGRFHCFSHFLIFPAMCYISVIQMTDSLLHLLRTICCVIVKNKLH